MIEIYNKWDNLIIENEKKEIVFNTTSLNVLLDGFDVTYPGEYEKSWTLLEVIEYSNTLFYKFIVDSKRVLIVTKDNFDLKEEILSFFWDVDVLIIAWTKEAANIFESIEAKIVVPYWESKWLFLTTLGQHIQEEESIKIKSELPIDSTLFINLK